MSALLTLSAQKINICAEYGYCNRKFAKRPRYLAASNYASAMLLVYRQSEPPLPNRNPEYRNHFTLFHSKRDILVVRSETTLVFSDNDAVLLYDRIEPSRSGENRFRTTYNAWDVSFDREIAYDNQRPRTFTDYELVCSGEWWFFDRGIVLNGVTRYVPGHESMSLLMYYELHTPMRVSATSSLPTPISATTTAAKTTMTNTIYDSTVTANAFDYRLPGVSTITGLVPDRILPYVNSTARPSVRENDTDRVDSVSYEAVMPSLYWFVTRGQELRRGDISYFLPINYTGRRV